MSTSETFCEQFEIVARAYQRNLKMCWVLADGWLTLPNVPCMPSGPNCSATVSLWQKRETSDISEIHASDKSEQYLSHYEHLQINEIVYRHIPTR